METSPRKKTRILLIGLLFLLVAAVMGAGLYVNRQYQPMDSNDQNMIEVRVPQNSTAHSVATLLQENGLIRNEKLFLVYCYQQGWETDLKAGLYTFSKSQSLPQLAQQIAEGKVKTSSFTIPEGYTVRQIGELLIGEGICSQTQWNEALHSQYDYAFLPTGITDNEKKLEGYLFPDTYTIEEQTGTRVIIDTMLANFARVWAQDFAAQAEGRQQRVGTVINIAALIEREARVAEERQRIAGVIYNRLQKGMPLQIDATVLYSLGEHREMVTYQDLEVDSPYNTYRNAGLPPGPIASPGRAAIDAALNPEVHNYYYYVAKGDGSHQFSSTYDEHLAAVQKYGK
jgi:UPF0755 protein